MQELSEEESEKEKILKAPENEQVTGSTVICYVDRANDECPNFTSQTTVEIMKSINTHRVNNFLAAQFGSVKGNCYGISVFLMNYAERSLLKEGMIALKMMDDCAHVTEEPNKSATESELIDKLKLYEKLLNKKSTDKVEYKNKQDLLDKLFIHQFELGKSIARQSAVRVATKAITYDQRNQFDLVGHHRQSVNLREDKNGMFLDKMGLNEPFCIHLYSIKVSGGHIIFCQKVEDEKFLVFDTFFGKKGLYKEIISKQELLKHLNGKNIMNMMIVCTIMR